MYDSQHSIWYGIPDQLVGATQLYSDHLPVMLSTMVGDHQQTRMICNKLVTHLKNKMKDHFDSFTRHARIPLGTMEEIKQRDRYVSELDHIPDGL